jgi:maleylpyruvate isomerase
VSLDPLVLLPEVDRATDRLLRAARALDDPAVAGASLLPGWTRGHVLTHLARNAEGCVNLLTWARTGVETPQYPSLAARARDIEAGASRPAAAHAADLAATAARFDEAVAAMPPAAWSATVRWTAGESRPAAAVLWSRLREVEVHHVDLDVGYSPADWPDAFAHRLLHELGGRLPGPSLRLRATDLGHDLTLGEASGAPTASGPGYALAAWLSGRSAGDQVRIDPPGPLPPVPAWS